ncbi:multicopper oxidase family protein [Mollicutes bacterium LVI A0078]|nr:multicopper oxidase family protein [Mollicutes bacterium LVI A0075]WOO91340.1 multicopper oxidase family protein [Mollicutes bacterium LVI A0078]
MIKYILSIVSVTSLILVVGLLLTNSESSNIKFIQDQEFKAATGYQLVEKELVLTNNNSDFLINGEVVPEEIRIKPNTTLEITVVNDSDYSTSVHFHGINGDSNMDGVAGISQDSIEPGSSFTYKFNIADSGTYMYHAHVDSVNQVNNSNLYGGLVVEEETKENSDMLMFNAKILDQNQHHTANQYYTEALVNGKFNDSLQIDSDENIYLNIVNMASAPLSINFGKDINYRVTSVDANPTTSDIITNKSLIVPTAQRLIVEIENPKHSFQVSTSLKTKENATYNVYYKDDKEIVSQDFSGSLTGGMMSNTEFSNLDDNSILIYDLVESTENLGLKDKKPDVNVNMELEMNGGYWTINDQAFPDAQSIDVKEGDVVEVTLSNNSHMAETHPFHLHGHQFEVVETNGQKLDKSLILDTVDVEPGNEVVIRFVADNPGIWAFHCHNLIHAGLGMMTTLNYQGYESNISEQVTE